MQYNIVINDNKIPGVSSLDFGIEDNCHPYVSLNIVTYTIDYKQLLKEWIDNSWTDGNVIEVKGDGDEILFTHMFVHNVKLNRNTKSNRYIEIIFMKKIVKI